MQFFHDARDFQGAVGVRQPVQVDADGFGLLACEEAGTSKRRLFIMRSARLTMRTCMPRSWR